MYEVVVARCAARTLRLALDDLADTLVDTPSGDVSVAVRDQSRLVAAIDRIHGLGLVIEHIDHVEDRREEGRT